jgi:prepilin-type processing-associated H-X9-DG protein
MRNEWPVRYSWGRSGFTLSKLDVVVLGGMLVLVAMIFWPSRGGSRAEPRSTCAVNLRGIMQSMILYAQDNNGALPVVMYAPYGTGANGVKGVSSRTRDSAAALRQYYAESKTQAGNVPACMWILAMNGSVAPKQFVCPTDRFGKRDGTMLADKGGNLYDNFQNGKQLSYSMAYPWTADGVVGAWWKDTQDAALPLLADMTPRQGTGKPARDVTAAAVPADPRTWNSGNHQGEGQNVAYADGHADFSRRPDVGQEGDNIYSMSGVPSRGPARFGGVAAGAAGGAGPQLMAEKAPFDVVMVPVRDESTGGM